ncbi:MAG: hypothetical protein WCL14_03245 [Bacteroidota bacterium]
MENVINKLKEVIKETNEIFPRGSWGIQNMYLVAYQRLKLKIDDIVTIEDNICVAKNKLNLLKKSNRYKYHTSVSSNCCRFSYGQYYFGEYIKNTADFLNFINNKDVFLNKIQGHITLDQYRLFETLLYPKKLQKINPIAKPDKIQSFRKKAKTKLQKGGGGESKYHKSFKERIARNPSLIKIPLDFNKTELEYTFISLDAIDILFTYNDKLIGVEVKSIISNRDDIERGLYQCVKYKSLLEAELKANNKNIDVRVILVIEGEFPIDLDKLKKTLEIEIIQCKGE